MTATSRLEAFTRLGFAARGLLYLAVAFLAIHTGRNTDSPGVLRSLAEDGVGRLILLVVALGLLGYGLWRSADAALDLEGEAEGAKGVARRLGSALSGVVHLGLALFAIALALGMGGGGGGGGGEDAATARLMNLPGGELLTRLLALGFIAGGLAQGWSAYRLKFLKQLDPGAADRAWVKWSGRLGYLARGVVFLLIGIFIWQAAASANPQQAGGADEALASLDGWHRIVVAVGLGLFGVFSIVQAIYRRITAPRVLDRLSIRGSKTTRHATRADHRRT